MSAETGWQAGGSYVPCPECRWEPPVERNRRPGRAVQFPGTTHYADCPTIPRLSPEAQRRLQEQLDDIARCRRRAMASAHSYVIG